MASSSRKMDPAPVAATRAPNPERYCFWIERMITVILSTVWLYSCHSFSTDSKNPFFVFNLVAYASIVAFVYTNIVYLVGLLVRAFRNHGSSEQDPQGGWVDLLRLAFWIERFGMLVLCVSCYCYILGGFKEITSFGICTGPCLILFPSANLCYLGRFVLGEELSLLLYEKKRTVFGNWFGGLQKITSFGICNALLFPLWPFFLLDEKLSLWSKEKEVALGKGSQRTKAVTDGDDADDTSLLRDMGEWETDSELYEDGIPDLEEEEEAIKETNQREKEPDKAISEASFEMLDIKEDEEEFQKVKETEEEKQSDKAVSEESFAMLDNKDDELQGKLEELEPVNEKAKQEEKESYKTLSEESFEMMDTIVDNLKEKVEELEGIEESKEGAKQEHKEKGSDKSVSQEKILEMGDIKDDKQRGKIQELEKELEIVKERAQRLGEFSKEIAERCRRHCKMWEKQKDEYVCRLSAAASQAEFYRLQALESEENRRKLEDEKDGLMMKLCAANAVSELYRSLLHDSELFM